MKISRQDMLRGPLFSGVISYAVPIILTSVLQLLFNTMDIVVVGRFCGSISVAAVSNTSELINLITTLFIGLSVGTGVSVAHALGGRQEQTVHKIVHTALPLAVISGFILTAVGVIYSDFFLELMNTPENVLPLSGIYMKIYFAGVTFSMIYNFSASILRAAGDTKGPLVYLLIAGVVNVVLNMVFVTVFHMDVAGVALATIISQGVSAVLVVAALMRRTDACKLSLKRIRCYGPQLIKMIKLGLPAGLQGALFGISNVIVQSFINSFGDVLMSGNGAAANIEGFIYFAFHAFYETAVNYTGQNAGANQYKRIRKIYATCLGLSLIITLGLSLLVYVFGRQLLGIYITDSPEAIEHGMVRLGCVCLLYFLCTPQHITTGVLRGMGASLSPMLISVLGICGFRLAWIYTVFQIPQYHTPQCLYLSYVVSWIITFVILFIAFLLVYRKRVKQSMMHLK